VLKQIMPMTQLYSGQERTSYSEHKYPCYGHAPRS